MNKSQNLIKLIIKPNKTQTKQKRNQLQQDCQTKFTKSKNKEKFNKLKKPKNIKIQKKLRKINIKKKSKKLTKKIFYNKPLIINSKNQPKSLQLIMNNKKFKKEKRNQ